MLRHEIAMSIRKLCVITGSRAEYGLLFWLLKEVENDPDFELQIIATGMHLSTEYGLTYKAIESDGFEINEKIEILLSSDSALSVLKSMGLGLICIGEALERLNPDLIIILGDRFEILAAAQAALILKIPVAHIAGGDTTEGAFDESIRHSITKMSHIHFVTNEHSAKRVMQLGENPQYIFNYGNPGLDHITRTKLLDKNELEDILGISFKKTNILVTFHPATLESQSSVEQFQQLLNAMSLFKKNTMIIFTKPNADPEGRNIISKIEKYIQNNDHAVAFTSMGQKVYLSTLKYVDVVVGNSSSGIYEVPSFKIPTVNIGERQKGRLQSDSIINTEPLEQKIFSAIKNSLNLDCSNVVNPYGGNDTSVKIVKKLKEIPDYTNLLKKHFFISGATYI